MRPFNWIYHLVLIISRLLARSLILTTVLGIGLAQAQILYPQTISSIEKLAKNTTSQVRELDDLFIKLKRETDDEKAKQIALRIIMNWTSSGSATVDILMEWAQQAIKDKRYGSALELLDQVIVLVPDYVEGWNRRATLHYIMGHHKKSMADIKHTLALEPRHFGALIGMTAILSTLEEHDKVLKIFGRILSIYPANKNVQNNMIKLLQKLEKDTF